MTLASKPTPVGRETGREQRERLWQENLSAITEWLRSHPGQHPPTGELSNWVYHQRRQRRNGQMPLERFEALNAVPGWRWESTGRNRDWEQWRQSAEAFYANAGPGEHPSKVEQPLRAWVTRQRVQRRNGRLSDVKAAALDNIDGWAWNRNEVEQQRWLLRFEQFRQHQLTHPSVHPPEPGAVRRWVLSQRQQYQQGTLSTERIGMLETVDGWTWDPLGEDWDRRYNEYRKWCETSGPGCLPLAVTSIGKWASRQRGLHRAGKLSVGRAQRLDAIDG